MIHQRLAAIRLNVARRLEAQRRAATAAPGADRARMADFRHPGGAEGPPPGGDHLDGAADRRPPLSSDGPPPNEHAPPPKIPPTPPKIPPTPPEIPPAPHPNDQIRRGRAGARDIAAMIDRLPPEAHARLATSRSWACKGTIGPGACDCEHCRKERNYQTLLALRRHGLWNPRRAQPSAAAWLVPAGVIAIATITTLAAGGAVALLGVAPLWIMAGLGAILAALFAIVLIGARTHG